MNKILSISNKEYHSLPALSFSSYKEFFKSPAHYQAYINKPYTKATDSQDLGTLVHKAILEPDDFELLVQVVEGNRNATRVKQEIEALEAAGCMVVKPAHREAALRARDAIYSHPIIKDLLFGGIAEGSIVTTDAETGAPIKCRPDYFIQAASVILDLKTFDDLTDRSVERQIVKQRYQLQGLHYLNVCSNFLKKPIRLFGNIFIETEPPYGVRLVTISDASLEKAAEQFKYKETLAKFKACLDSNEWPNYPIEPYDAELFF